MDRSFDRHHAMRANGETEVWMLSTAHKHQFVRDGQEGICKEQVTLEGLTWLAVLNCGADVVDFLCVRADDVRPGGIFNCDPVFVRSVVDGSHCVLPDHDCCTRQSAM